MSANAERAGLVCGSTLMVSDSETVNPLESVTTSLTSVYPDIFSVPSSSAPVVWLSAYMSPQKAAIFEMDAP